MSAETSPLQELADAGRASATFMINAEFELPRGKVLTAVAYTYRGYPRAMAHVQVNETSGNRSVWNRGTNANAKDLGDALRLVAADYPKAVLRPEALKLHVRKGPATAARFKPVIVRAWYEALGQPVPSLEDLAKARKTVRDAVKATAGGAVAELRGGPAGVAKFNARPAAERAKADLRKADLSGCDLTGVQFNAARLDGADLSGSTMARAEFTGKVGHRLQSCTLKKARLARSNLTGANLWGAECAGADFGGANLSDAVSCAARFPGADFTGAVLARADARGCNFQGALLRRADLTDTVLMGCNLRGADLTGAKLAGAQLDSSVFAGQTKWPRGYKAPGDLRWKGAGPDPRLAPSRKTKRPTDFAGFLDRLRNAADPAKLAKALAMLKAERFQLFAKVEPTHLAGVVKSQSSGELVYACRLSSEGRYACCTQNLNVCGGLRGSPCKHLLVLLVGLAQAGALDPAAAHDWSQAARGRKGELDKDAMTETFLRYKGAEAGEVDWRPTETIPEDFYTV